MFSRVRTFLLVTLFATILWVFAESESLGEFAGITTVRFSSGTGEGNTRLISPDQAFDGTISIDLVGSKGAISRSETELIKGIELAPGMAGVPTLDGRHTINLLRVLQDYAPLTRTGVRIATVTPLALEVEVLELVAQQAVIEANLQGIDVVGEVRVTPDRVAVRLPRSALTNGQEPIRVTARLDETQRKRLPVSGPVKEEAAIIPPSAYAGLPGFSIERATATLEFTVRGRSATETLRSIPVQIVLPPVEIGRWDVQIESEDRFLTADVSGPTDAMERLKSGAEAVIAVLSLSSDDLEAKVEKKDAAFMVLKSGAFMLRPELQIVGVKSSVRLKITPKSAPGPTP